MSSTDARDAEQQLKTPKKKDKPRSRGGFLGELAMIFVVALVLSFLFKTFVMRAFFIPSGSMENTLEINDRIFVNKMMNPQEVKRGEIVVFHDDANWQPATTNPNPVRKALEFVGVYPADSQHYLIKRVIGLPGDHVQSTADGKIMVNGTVLSEDYIYPGDRPTDIAFDVVVPEGKLWVMGDHRSRSADSRYHMAQESKGFIPKSSVEGTAWFIAYPFDRVTGLSSGTEVFKDVPAPASSAR